MARAKENPALTEEAKPRAEPQDGAAHLRAIEEKIAAKEAAKKTSISFPKTAPETLAQLPPELRILAQRRARFDSGDREVHREIFGRQERTMAKGVDDWDVW